MSSLSHARGYGDDDVEKRRFSVDFVHSRPIHEPRPSFRRFNSTGQTVHGFSDEMIPSHDSSFNPRWQSAMSSTSAQYQGQGSASSTAPSYNHSNQQWLGSHMPQSAQSWGDDFTPTSDSPLYMPFDAGVSPSGLPAPTPIRYDQFTPERIGDFYTTFDVSASPDAYNDPSFADIISQTRHSSISSSSSCSSPGPYPFDLSGGRYAGSREPSPTSSETLQDNNPRRRFPCLLQGCNRRFTSQYTLKVHMEAHKPKPKVTFPCTHGCSERFSRQHDRLRHEVAKHGKVCEFLCSECGRFFSTKKTLGNHKCPMAPGGTRWVVS